MVKSGPGIAIEKVLPGSIGSRLGLAPGDRLLAVNGVLPRDLLHYRYLVAGEEVVLTVLRQDGRRQRFSVRKAPDEDPGLVFATPCFDGIKKCRNKCLFCFVDQLPPGLRPALYLKDDDYRLSFLCGNFVTLTNLTPAEIQRIVTFHLSPLYVSVHATRPEVRARILGRKEDVPVLEVLRSLTAAGIEVHAQVVLCPGINDGEVLRETIRDLAALWPGVRSVGVVPVGLTRYRRDPSLRGFTRAASRSLVAELTPRQASYRKRFGVSFVYLADEFYLKARLTFPPARWYDGYPQFENGIGMARAFWEEFRELVPRLPRRCRPGSSFTVVTGKAGALVLRPVVARLNLIPGLKVSLLPVFNSFFGPRVTVSGLLTGRDLARALRLSPVLEGTVLVPRSLLREGTSLLLDGLTLEEVAEEARVRVRALEPTARALVAAVLGRDRGQGG